VLRDSSKAGLCLGTYGFRTDSPTDWFFEKFVLEPVAGSG
jgi:hypothetical protein